MITAQEIEGRWNEVKGRIQQRWGELTDDELQQARGSANQLIGLIQQRTGETREAIEDFLEEALGGGAAIVDQTMETARQYAEQARQAAARSYEQMAAGVGRAQETVRRNPMESVAVAFGAGLIAGVVMGLVVKSDR